MSGSIDIYTVIFLGLAVVIFLRLRSVLGRRTGQERPPFDPFARREAPRRDGDKVIALPPRLGRDAAPSPPPVETPSTPDLDARVKRIAAPGTPLAEAARELMVRDPAFDPQAFLEGARVAYEMVVTAFAQGDRRALRDLLSREVNDGFVAAIAERERRQETIAFKFVGIEKAEITDVATRAGAEQVTVRFVSQLISATKDKDAKIVDGDETRVGDVTDIWTFAREIGARDPNWRLVATEFGGLSRRRKLSSSG